MRSKFNVGVVIVIAVLLFVGAISVFELYKLHSQADGGAMVQINRSISTIVIGVGICISMLLMLMLFFNLYYMRHVRRINSALKHYLMAHTPFNPVFNGDKELLDMKDMIERLVEQNKRILKDN